MEAFLENILVMPTGIFTILLGFISLYWGFVFIGVADLDLFDGADGLEGAIDGGIEGASETVAEIAAEAAAEAVKINLRVKQIEGAPISIQVYPTITVAQLKERIASIVGAEADVTRQVR